jgi:hypothetical protein
MKCTYVIRLMQHQFHITQTKLKTYTNCTFCIVPTGLMSYMYVKPWYLPPPPGVPRGPSRGYMCLGRGYCMCSGHGYLCLAVAICALPWLFEPFSKKYKNWPFGLFFWVETVFMLFNTYSFILSRSRPIHWYQNILDL